MTQSRWWAAVLLVATFAAGATVGAVGVSAWRGPERDRPRPEGARQGRDGNRERGFASMLARELNLTPEQKDSVKAIVKRYEPAMREVMESTRPRIDSLRARIHADIQKVLTEQQRADFQRWVARTDSLGRHRGDRDRTKEKASER